MLTSEQQERKRKQRKLRNSEYYDMETVFDSLYAKSKDRKIFNHLMEIIESEENIKLAYRTVKKNSGSNTAGVDKRTIKDLMKLSEEEYVCLIRKQFSNYHPRPVRRVEIPKPNGKMRPLGIPTIVDRVVQQCVLQVIEPICEARFSENSNGFRPNRSAETAIAQCMRLIQVQHLYHVVDLDIKGFFDNINHTKLIRQIWALGIQDKKLLCILKEMLKAPIIMPNGEKAYPKKGTPQGGILSPLLANIVLNELDWWIASQWEEIPTKTAFKTRNNAQGTIIKSHSYRALRTSKGSNELHFFYDAQNKPAVVVFNGTPYSYVKNLQGDIVAILDSNKNVVVNYVYDAWGRPIKKEGSLVATLGTVQPFRYRGYVYDEETGLYYLRSRYYDSGVCRFINSDSIIVENIILGQNQYIYSKNDPIQYGDEDGAFWKKLAGIVVGAVTVVASVAIAAACPTPLGMSAAGAVMGLGTEIGSALLFDKETSVADVLSSTVTGAIEGLIPGNGFGWSLLRSVTSSAVDAMIHEGVDWISTDPNDNYSFKFSDFLISTGFNLLGEGIGDALGKKIDKLVSETAYGGNKLQPRHYRQMASLEGRQMGRMESKRLRRYVQKQLIPAVSEYAQTYADFYFGSAWNKLEAAIN